MTDKTFKLEVDKIKNGIKKRKLRWFGYCERTREERLPKKILHTKMEEKRPR